MGTLPQIRGLQQFAKPRDSSPGSFPAAKPAAIPSGGSAVLAFFGAALAVNHMARPFDAFLKGIHIPLVICSLAALAVAFGGGLAGLKSRTGLALIAVVSWMTAISPLGFWALGSLMYVKDYVGLMVILFLCLATGPRSIREVRLLLRVLAGACFISILLSSFASGGRAGGTNATYGNSDDFALLIGFVLPFCVFFAMELRNKIVRTIALAAMTGLLFRLLIATATRSAVLSLAVTTVVLLFRVSAAKRFGIIGAVAVGGVLVAVSVPSSALQRLSTITAVLNTDSAAGVSEATDSVAERRDLQMDALKMIGSHPIFGVGPAQYMNYRYNMFEAGGGHKRWFPAHNTYLQIGAEQGVFGLLLYILFLGSIYNTIARVRKMNAPGSHPETLLVGRIALCLELSFVFFVLCSAFLNCDHYPHIFIVAGFAAALERLTRAAAGRPVLSRAAAVSPPARWPKSGPLPNRLVRSA